MISTVTVKYDGTFTLTYYVDEGNVEKLCTKLEINKDQLPFLKW